MGQIGDRRERKKERERETEREVYELFVIFLYFLNLFKEMLISLLCIQDDFFFKIITSSSLSSSHLKTSSEFLLIFF